MKKRDGGFDTVIAVGDEGNCCNFFLLLPFCRQLMLGNLL